MPDNGSAEDPCERPLTETERGEVNHPVEIFRSKGGKPFVRSRRNGAAVLAQLCQVDLHPATPATPIRPLGWLLAQPCSPGPRCREERNTATQQAVHESILAGDQVRERRSDWIQDPGRHGMGFRLADICECTGEKLSILVQLVTDELNSLHSRFAPSLVIAVEDNARDGDSQRIIARFVLVSCHRIVSMGLGCC